tara:strand:- start:155 stop:313 length:159 start_codon:yes stop_codon:yes gene_type:complete
MDIKRYKSVAVQKEVWEKLWKIAREESRSPSNQIEWFVKNYKNIKQAMKEHG